MTLNRKYAALPDLVMLPPPSTGPLWPTADDDQDSAPDIYETPELTDDNSTAPTTTNRAPSEHDFEDTDEAKTRSISRSRLRIDEARSRFFPANVNATGVNFSDRVDGKRRSYKVSSRRRRILEDGTEEYGNLSDDDDEESLERKIARLSREVEEAKQDYARQTSASAAIGDAESNDATLDSLSKMLDDISQPGSFAPWKRSSLPPAETKAAASSETVPADWTTYTITYAPTYQQSHALAKAADFDGRLLKLEQVLGINASWMAEMGQSGLPRAILPTLDSLEKQISTLAQASTANLDAISRRVRNLASEQDRLNESREKAKALREELGKHTPVSPSNESEQEAKVNALYSILPAIEGLTPMLPPLLDRLRSLRSIHADAAAASQTLDLIESQQSEMTRELKQWREGLEKVEEAIKKCDTAVGNNMKAMESWVKDLEQRMAKLA